MQEGRHVATFVFFVLLQLLVTSFVLGIGMDDRLEEHETQWAVQLQPGQDPDELAEAHGFENLGKIGALEDHFLFQLKPQHRTREVATDRAKRLADAPTILWIEQQVPTERVKRPLSNNEDI
jgi:hypothetical protein